MLYIYLHAEGEVCVGFLSIFRFAHVANSNMKMLSPPFFYIPRQHCRPMHHRKLTLYHVRGKSMAESAGDVQTADDIVQVQRIRRFSFSPLHPSRRNEIIGLGNRCRNISTAVSTVNPKAVNNLHDSETFLPAMVYWIVHDIMALTHVVFHYSCR